MTLAIILYDQLLFRPLVASADKFRFEQTASQVVPKSWVLNLLSNSLVLRHLASPLDKAFQQTARAPLTLPASLRRVTRWTLPRHFVGRMGRAARRDRRLYRMAAGAVRGRCAVLE
jgi:NitT/TauT family transport system permease protein